MTIVEAEVLYAFDLDIQIETNPPAREYDPCAETTSCSFCCPTYACWSRRCSAIACNW